METWAESLRAAGVSGIEMRRATMMEDALKAFVAVHGEFAAEAAARA